MGLSIILVMCSGLAHAVWNLLAKSSDDKAVFLWSIYMPSTIVLLPVLISEAAHTSFTPQQGGMLLFSLLLQAGYALLLSWTYKKGDLSQVYPIMRGTSTLLVPLLGVLFLRERLPFWGWCGIACMIGGFLLMGGRFGRTSGGSHSPAGGSKPVWLALSVGVIITTYTLVDKWNLQVLSPLALLTMTNIGFILGLTPSVLKHSNLRAALFTNWRTLMLGWILSPGSYLLFLLAVRHGQVASIAPLREIGIVFGTILGLTVLKEAFPVRRLLASGAVLIGILLVASHAH